MISIVYENISRLLHQAPPQLNTKPLFSCRKTIDKLKSSNYQEKNIKLSTVIFIAQHYNVNFVSLFMRNSSLNALLKTHYEPNDFLSNYIKNVKSILVTKRKTQCSLSSEGGIQPSTISNLLKGKTNDPYLSTLSDIAIQLDIDLYKLFVTEGDFSYDF